MHPIAILLLIIVFGVLAFLKLRKGTFVNKLTKDLWNEHEQEPDEVIKDISAAEKALQATAKANEAEAKKLQGESAKIGEYLADKGVVKPKPKRKESKKKK